MVFMCYFIYIATRSLLFRWLYSWSTPWETLATLSSSLCGHRHRLDMASFLLETCQWFSRGVCIIEVSSYLYLYLGGIGFSLQEIGTALAIAGILQFPLNLFAFAIVSTEGILNPLLLLFFQGNIYHKGCLMVWSIECIIKLRSCRLSRLRLLLSFGLSLIYTIFSKVYAATSTAMAILRTKVGKKKKFFL